MFKKIRTYFSVKFFKNYSVKFGAVVDKASKIAPDVNIGKSSMVANSQLDKFVIIDSKTRINFTTIEEKVKIYSNTNLFNCDIGKYTYIGQLGVFAYAKIGSFCSIGRNVHCAGAIHPMNRISTHPVFYSANKQCGYSFVKKNTFDEFKSIEIGNDVWIGSNVTILGGLKIGNGAIIGAGSVLTKDVPDFAIFAGNPAKLIRYRFDESIQKEIKAIGWWNWSEDKIKSNLSLFEKIY